MQVLEHLQQIKIFQNLPPPYVAALAAACKREHFEPGQRIVTQGDLGSRFFIVDAGLVNLRQTDKDAVERSIGVIPTPPSQKSSEPPTRYFGEQMFSTQAQFEFNADAVRPTDAYVITRRDYDALVEKRPAIPHMLGFVRTAEKKRTHGFRWVTEGETVALVERKHWWALVLGLLPVAGLALAAFLVLAALRLFLVSDVLNPITVGAVVIVLLSLVWAVNDWINDEYVVTSQRVAHVERVYLTLDLRESVPLEKVLGVTLTQTFPTNFLGCSTVVVQTAGREKGNVTFEYARHGERIRKAIESQKDRVRAREHALDRERFRQNVHHDLANFLAPDVLAAERDAQPPSAPAPPPPRPSIWQAVRDLVASMLNLELKQADRTIWRKHWIVLLRQTSRWLAGLIILTVAAAFFALNPGLRFPGYWLGGLVLVGICVLGLAYQWEDWRNDTYSVTTSHVIDTEARPLGLGSKSTTAPLEQVQDIRVETKGTLAFLLNFGDLKIETAGQGGQMVFHSIHNPRGAQEEVFRRLEAFRARRAEHDTMTRSRTVVDALMAYDLFKTNQTQTASGPAQAEPAPQPVQDLSAPESAQAEPAPQPVDDLPVPESAQAEPAPQPVGDLPASEPAQAEPAPQPVQDLRAYEPAQVEPAPQPVQDLRVPEQAQTSPTSEPAHAPDLDKPAQSEPATPP